MYNKTILVGRLGKDVELRYTAGGDAVANFSVACSNKYKEKETTFWGDVVVWGKTAENCNQYIGKGSLVLVEGRLETREWESNGEKRRKVEIVASTVKFLDKRGEGSGSSHADAGTGEGDLEPF